MPYPRMGLDYYAMGTSAPIHKLATLVREQGGLRPLVSRLSGLDAVDHDTAWANLLASYEWVNAHPLPDDAPADVVNTRNLLLNALVAAQAKLQGDPNAGSNDPSFQAAQAAYQAHATAARNAEMPSAFMQGLAHLGDTLGSGVSAWGGLLLNPTKLLVYAGVAVGLYLLASGKVRLPQRSRA